MYSDTGISINQLQELSSKLSIRLQSFSCDFNVLDEINKKEIPFGALIKINELQHMVIITKISKSKIEFFDPIYGIKKLSKSEFATIYLGVLFKFSKNSKMNKDFVNKTTSFEPYFYAPYLFILLVSLINKIATPFVTKILLGTIYFSYSFADLFIVLAIFTWLQISTQLFYVLAYKIVNRHIIKAVFKQNNQLINLFKTNPDKILFQYSDTEIMNRFSAIKETNEFKFTFWSETFVDILTLILALFFLYFSNNLILLICIAYSFLCLFINIFVSNKTKVFYSKLKEKSAIYNSNLYGIINSLRTNSNTNYYNFLKNKTNDSLLHLNEDSFKNSSFLNYWNCIIEFFSNILPFGVYIIAIIAYWTSQQQLQEFIFFLTGISLITFPIKSINSKIMLWKNNEQNMFLLETFNLLKPNNVKELKTLNFNEKCFIEIKDLVFKLKGKKILDIPKLKIDKNACIIGSNGKGKSTLVKLINGVYKEYFGEINLIKNNEVFSLKKWNIEFGFVSNEEFFPNIKIIEYLTNNQKNRTTVLEKIFKQYDLNLAFEILNLNLEVNLINNASNLSSGQKKFISIVKLLLSDCKIIFLDEAFENLDKKISQFLKECLLEKFKDSIFIEISHNNNYVNEQKEVIDIERINEK